MHIVVAGGGSDIAKAFVEFVAPKHQITIGARDAREIPNKRANTHELDILSNSSIQSFVKLVADGSPWDILLIFHGTTLPIGHPRSLRQDEWQRCFHVNLFGPVELIKTILAAGSLPNRTIVTFSGAGINGWEMGMTPYVTSKLALVKVMEQLHHDWPDHNFVSAGTRFVDTKIHNELGDSDALTRSYRESRLSDLRTNHAQMSSSDLWNFVCWAHSCGRRVVGGRNFSIMDDPWRDPSYRATLESSESLNRMRRVSNS